MFLGFTVPIGVFKLVDMVCMWLWCGVFAVLVFFVYSVWCRVTVAVAAVAAVAAAVAAVAVCWFTLI